MSLFQQFGANIGTGLIPVSTTAAKVATLAAALNPKIDPQTDLWGIALTNNDPTNTVYLAYANSVTSTNFYRRLLPNDVVEMLIGLGPFRNLWIVSGAGTPNVHIEAFG